jgi:putative tricarboxylic transport membrane protein
MQSRDYRDMLGGALLVVFGAFIAYYSIAHYALGTFRRMGPGMFPALLGGVLCLLGVFIFIPAFSKAGGEMETIEWRSFLTVVGAFAVFALTVDSFGIVPAIMLMTVVAAYADGRLKPLGILILGGAMSALVILIFRVILGSPFTLFDWPF